MTKAGASDVAARGRCGPGVGLRRFTSHELGATAVAAAAMVATLPGRTHGLGLVTEPILADLVLDRVAFAALNFWTTILGAAFCLPVGSIVDRLGAGRALAVTLAALGGVVVAMAGLGPRPAAFPLPAPDWIVGGKAATVAVPGLLFLLVLLTRGLGQSSLSVESLAIVGKAAGDRPGRVIGLYSFLVAIGFMAAFVVVKRAFIDLGLSWRSVWCALGISLLVFAAVAPFLRTEGPRAGDATEPAAARGATLAAALATPAFWVFALATSFYGLVAAGLSLFNESLLAERGFERSVFLSITAISPLIGLAANLAGGWLAGRLPLGWIAGVALLLQGAALAAFPRVGTLPAVYAYAAVMGVAGGLLTVVFFSVWRQAFGAAHLGAIQGAAQALTVLASAAGPLVLAVGQKAAGSYAPVVVRLAGVSLAFAFAAFLVPLPRPVAFEESAPS